MTQLRTTQIFDTAKSDSLDNILANLTPTTDAGSITLPGGTIIKWGNTGAFASIPANSTATETLVFGTPFPLVCEAFFALLTPASSTDFYGVTSLVSKSATQAQFTVRNGATAQAIASGVYVAIGK